MKTLKGFYSVLIQSRPHVVSYSMSNRWKVFFRLCRTGRDAHLRAVSDIMGYSIACFSQNCSGLLKLSRWHLQTLRPIVSSPDKCGFNTNSSLFSCKRLSISTVFGSDFSLRRDSALYNWVYWQLSIYLSYLPCPRQLSHYSNHAANRKLASFSAASADAVSFEFDDINVTAQRVMTQTATLMAACSPFTTNLSRR